ncbi:MAG TPA: class I tRNA ligase family protein, partial [Ignavibacteriaceae bacterium]|nr:class I tRNA ligase family protein [Ignavibacteriaceae bacterium]
SGAKMSKSKGNVVNPDDFTKDYGADVFRLYLMFMGPYELGGDWSDKGISGTDRFVQKVYDIFTRYENILNNAKPKDVYNLDELNDFEKAVYKKINQTIKKYDEEINNFRFNTAIASLMELLNELKNIDKYSGEITAYTLQRFAVLIAPVAPHLGEECWNLIGNDISLMEKPVWYSYDQKALIEDIVKIAVQVNGKLRATIEMPTNSEQELVKKSVFQEEKVTKHTVGKQILKEIYVKNKIYNIVAK